MYSLVLCSEGGSQDQMLSFIIRVSSASNSACLELEASEPIHSTQQTGSGTYLNALFQEGSEPNMAATALNSITSLLFLTVYAHIVSFWANVSRSAKDHSKIKPRYFAAKWTVLSLMALVSLLHVDAALYQHAQVSICHTLCMSFFTCFALCSGEVGLGNCC